MYEKREDIGESRLQAEEGKVRSSTTKRKDSHEDFFSRSIAAPRNCVINDLSNQLKLPHRKGETWPRKPNLIMLVKLRSSAAAKKEELVCSAFWCGAVSEGQESRHVIFIFFPGRTG